MYDHRRKQFVVEVIIVLNRIEYYRQLNNRLRYIWNIRFWNIRISNVHIWVSKVKAMLKSIHSARYQLFLGLLKQARLDAGVTQTELAETIGVTQSTISKMETGERRLDLVELLEICDAMHISQEDFLLNVIEEVGRVR